MTEQSTVFAAGERDRYFGDDDIKEILYTQQELSSRVRELGRSITQDYRERAYERTRTGEPSLIVISVLRGAAIYMSDLVREIDLPLEMDYMAVSSYGSGTKSSGVVRILKDLSSQIEGRHVLIAEDILDSGLTLKYLLRVLESRNPASIEVATLLRKQTDRQVDIDCKYVGFECPDEFIVGYGLDYAEHYRNLPYIGILKPEIYQGK
ncbi:MAG: hypoxanthine phosphoribosyltransferase [Slackia sp.]|nr:hypoxanthine phosphoribosyltransferase [Slackia sp.]